MAGMISRGVTDPVMANRFRSRRSHRLVGLSSLGLLLALCLSVAVAFADETGGEATPRPSVALEAYEALEADDPRRVTIDMTNSEAAAEMPHGDLDREEALDLLRSVFGPMLQAPAGAFDEFEGAQLLAQNVAVVPPSRQDAPQAEEATLVESTLPLKVEDSSGEAAVVDLGLEPRDGSLQPSNPLVDVEVPLALGEGIDLPEQGITIQVSQAPSGRSPSTVAESTAFYPNIAPDTDLTVAPTPTGVETLTQLRTPAAPLTQNFDLGLPAGATLRATAEGGAEIHSNGEPLLAIRPPSALDANGNGVPVSLTVSDSSVALTVSPEPDSAYPILVDPLYETFNWPQYYKSLLGLPGAETPPPGWYPGNNAPSTYGLYNRIPWEGNAYSETQRFGLNVMSGRGPYYANTRGYFDYYVPRYISDYNAYGVPPTTYIKHVTLQQLEYKLAFDDAKRPSPFFQAGIWDSINGGWIAVANRFGSEGGLSDTAYKYEFDNGNLNENGKTFGVGLLATESGPTTERRLTVGVATVELNDKDIPSFGYLLHPAKWVNKAPSSPAIFSVSDRGLGVSKATVTQPRVASQPLVLATKQGCVGGAEKPCPKEWLSETTGSPQLGYDPSALPQGVNWLKFDAYDPVGHRASEGEPPMELRVKVDHTAPQLDISGSLTEQATLGTLRSEYDLKLSATDGDAVAAAPLAPIGPAGTGEAKPQRPLGVAADRKGNVWVVDTENNRILRYDEEGKYLSQFGSTGTGNGQFMSPRGIAISPSGNIWVTDTGNARVQQFTSSGVYLQKFGVKAMEVQGQVSNETTFQEPYGITTAPGGKLWVSDTAGRRVGIFREDPGTEGRFIRDVYSTNANGVQIPADIGSPVGLASDSQGNVWVVDTAYDRLQAYDSNGKFLMQFGTEGVGNGQLKDPRNVTIAPSGHLLVSDSSNNRVQVYLPTGAYLRQFGTTGSGSGQLLEPRGVSVGANNVVFVADAGNRRIARWSHADLDRQAGVASSTIKVDGKVVDSTNSGCATENCTLNRSWTYKSSAYATGTHTVEATVTDGVGLPTSKSLTITSVKDTTPPTLTASGAFFNGPEGWLEQKSYFAEGVAKDSAGYGVASLAFKMDGTNYGPVKTQACPGGGCEAKLSGLVNVAQFSGGAHQAELIATDVAGNVTKKAWTIYVDPKGEVSAAEAADTLEALEETSETIVVSESPYPEEAMEGLGGAPPTYKQQGESIESVNAPVESVLSTDPDDGITLKTDDGTIKIEPLGTSDTASVEVVPGGEGALSSNTNSAADLVVRPIYTGAMSFQTIRDSSAPTQYSWEVRLAEDQTLKQIDSQFAQVYTEETHPTFGIRVTAAHDAIGTSVPTSLAVTNGKIITLTVHHRPDIGQPGFVYPVIAGAGWEGGFQTFHVEMPPPELPPESPEDVEQYFGGYAGISPPLPIDGGDAEASASGFKGVKKWFLYVECSHTGRWIEEAAGVKYADSQWTEIAAIHFKISPGKELPTVAHITASISSRRA